MYPWFLFYLLSYEELFLVENGHLLQRQGVIFFFEKKNMSKTISKKRDASGITAATGTGVSNKFKNMFEKTASKVKNRQDQKAPSDGEIHVSGIFIGFPVLRDVDNRKTTVEMTEPPERQWGKKIADGTPFPKPLKVHLNLNHLTPVPGFVEELEDGQGWRVMVECGFDKDAKAFLLANYQAYYKGVDESFHKMKVPMSEFIDEKGVLCTHRWVTLRHKNTYKAEVSDSENCVFRARVNGEKTGPLLITPRTELTLTKCKFTQWIRLTTSEKDDEAEIDLQGWTTISCRGTVRISERHDPNMPMSERVRRQEHPDVHSMIPVVDLAKGVSPPRWKSFMMFQSEYESPHGSPEGITFMSLDPKSLGDFISTYNNETQVKTIYRGLMFQWKHSPDTSNVQVYSVKASNYRDGWRSFGITDPDHYAHIMLANPIWSFAEVTLWRGDTLKQEENQIMIHPEQKQQHQEDDDEMSQLKGYYTWSIDSLTANYLGMLPRLGLAVSSAWVKEKFADFIGTKGKGDKTRTTMEFKPLDTKTPNPLHEKDLDSPVISLGNPKVDNPDADTPKPLYHAFNGDFWPRIDKVDFYVLTSHKLKDGEEEFYGQRANGDFSASEKFLNHIIEDEQVYWWLFAVNRDALKYVQQAAEPVAKKAVTSDTAVVQDAEPMDDGEDEHEEEEQEQDPKPKKLSAKTASKTVTKKKK